MIDFNHEVSDDLLKTGCVLYVIDRALDYDYNSDTIVEKAFATLLSILGKKVLVKDIDEVPEDLRVPEKPLLVKDNVIVKILNVNEIKDYV